MISRSLSFLAVLFLLVATMAATAQPTSPVKVKLAPSADGETSVQISVAPAEPVPFELPKIDTPTPPPKPAAATAPTSTTRAVPPPVASPAVTPPQTPAVSTPAAKPPIATPSLAQPFPAATKPAPIASTAATPSSPAAPPVAPKPVVAVAATPAIAATPAAPVAQPTAPASPVPAALPTSETLTQTAPPASLGEQVLRRRMAEIQAKVARGRNDEARRDYLKLAGSFPLADIAPEALFEAAKLEKASATNRAAEFAAISEKYPDTQWATRSTLELGQTQFLLGEFQAALDAYLSYQKQQGSEAQKPELRMNVITCLLQLRRYGNALDEIQRLETDQPKFRNTEKDLELKADCQIALAQYDNAIATLRALLRDYPNYALTPKALFCLGLCLEQTRKTDEARQAYNQVLQLFPAAREDAPFESKAATERLAAMSKPLFD